MSTKLDAQLQNSFCSLLGINSIKCICENETSSVMLSCAADILGHLESEHGSISLLNSIVQDFHTAQHCSVKTMICMVFLWSKEMEVIYKQNISSHYIISGLQQAIDICLSELVGVTINISDQLVNEVLPADKLTTMMHHTATAVADNSDIAWFFEDHRVPEVPILDSDVVDLISGVSTLQHNDKYRDEDGFICIENESIEHENLQRIKDKKVNKMIVAMQTELPTLTHCLSEDEFDSCTTLRGHLESKQSGSSSEDEFDSCFDDLVIPSNNSRSRDGEDNEHYQERNTSLDLEHKLQEIVNRKRKVKIANSVHNDSRHYKTISSTVQYLNANIKKYVETYDSSVDTQIDIDQDGRTVGSGIEDVRTLEDTDEGVDHDKDTALPSSADLEYKLQLVMNEKRRSMKSVHNESRHYKTITSTVEHLNENHQAAHHVKDDMKTDTETHTSMCVSHVGTLPSCERLAGTADDGEEKLRNTNSEVITLTKIIKGLCHGLEDKLGCILQGMFEYQQEDSNNVSFDPKLIHTICEPGVSLEYSAAVPGLVIPVDSDILFNLSADLCEKRTLLINGDLTESFRHKGYIKSGVIKHTCTQEMIPLHDTWLQAVQQLLRNLRVDMILVKGNIDADLQIYGASQDILMIPNVQYRVLQAISHRCQTQIAIYALDCDQSNIAITNIRELASDWRARLHSVLHYAIIDLDNYIQTAVICHPSTDICEIREEQFWHCAYRLHHSVQEKCVLAGEGKTELYCAEILEKHAAGLLQQPHTTNPYLSLIYHSVANGFKCYHAALCRNRGGQISDDVNKDCIMYDDYRSKTEAWGSAVHLVRQLLLVDQEIITGFDESAL